MNEPGSGWQPPQAQPLGSSTPQAGQFEQPQPSAFGPPTWHVPQQASSGYNAPPLLTPAGETVGPGPGSDLPPRKTKRTTAVVLAVVSVLLLASTGVFTTLFIQESNEHKAAVGRLDTRKRELTAVTAERSSTEPALRAAEQKVRTMESDLQRMEVCVGAAKAYIKLIGGDAVQRRIEINKMLGYCK